jgi:hypothetical protein
LRIIKYEVCRSPRRYYRLVVFLTACTRSLVDSLLMPVFIGLKHDDVERLYKMRGMRRETERYNVASLAVFEEFVRAVRFIAIHK